MRKLILTSTIVQLLQNQKNDEKLISETKTKPNLLQIVVFSRSTRVGEYAPARPSPTHCARRYDHTSQCYTSEGLPVDVCRLAAGLIFKLICRQRSSR